MIAREVLAEGTLLSPRRATAAMEQKLAAFAEQANLQGTEDEPRQWRLRDGDLVVEAVIWAGAEPVNRGDLGPVGPSPVHKGAVGLFRAGWFASHSDGDFLQQLWRVEPIAAALESALRADGEWARIERFFQE